MEEGPRVEVRLPRSLRQYWECPERVELRAASLAEALSRLEARFPGLGARVLDDQGRVRPHVGLFVNQAPVGHLEPREVALRPGDTVHIVPALSGG